MTDYYFGDDQALCNNLTVFVTSQGLKKIKIKRRGWGREEGKRLEWDAKSTGITKF